MFRQIMGVHQGTVDSYLEERVYGLGLGGLGFGA